MARLIELTKDHTADTLARGPELVRLREYVASVPHSLCGAREMLLAHADAELRFINSQAKEDAELANLLAVAKEDAPKYVPLAERPEEMTTQTPAATNVPATENTGMISKLFNLFRRK